MSSIQRDTDDMTSKLFVPLPDAAPTRRALRLVRRIMTMNAKAHWEEIRQVRRKKRPGKAERAAKDKRTPAGRRRRGV